jgi:hypothetical protein
VHPFRVSINAKGGDFWYVYRKNVFFIDGKNINKPNIESAEYEKVSTQGQTRGSTLMAHQQSLTTGPFRNTCKADVVSPEVVIGGCGTHMSKTRGNVKWI